jgi:hypothetical protein|tara:strand:- start:959 stop:1576 length:618 start_codon:yes stop_codon:yes gene_type:complete
MSCQLTAAVGLDCKDQIGGLKSVFFCNDYYENIKNVDTLTADSFIMTTAGFASWQDASGTTPATDVVNVFRYDLRPDLSSMTINTNASKTNGTTFFTQTLSLTLQKINAAVSYQLRLLAYNRVQVFVLDNNDNLFLLGYTNGCDVTAGTTVSGTAYGDLSGFTIEVSAEEREPYIKIGTAAPDPTDTQFPFDQLVDKSSITITTA